MQYLFFHVHIHVTHIFDDDDGNHELVQYYYTINMIMTIIDIIIINNYNMQPQIFFSNKSK